MVYVNDVAFILETLAPALREVGIEAHIVGRRPANPAFKRQGFLSQTLSSWQGIRASGRFDLLHVNYGLFGFLGLGFPKHPMVLHLHGDDVRPSRSPKGIATNLLSRIAARGAAAVWYSTPDLALELASSGIVGKYMPSPVADEFFRVPPYSRSTPTVLFAVPLGSVKGAEMAIQAMCKLAKEVPTLSLSAFGFGPNPTEAGVLRRQIPPGVHLLPWVEHRRVPEILAGASVVVGQLRLGILSLIELEAMAASRPLVVHLDVDAYLRERYYEVSPPVALAASAEDISAQVLRLVARDADRAKLAQDARQWAARYHSVQTVANQYREAYMQLQFRGGRAWTS